MSKIKVKCTDQVLTWINKPEISQGDQNLDSVVFECDSTWNGYVKVAVFFKQKGKLCYSMVDGTKTCSIPNSIMRENGKIYFGLTGTNRNNQVKTSNLLTYTIKDGVANASLNDEFPGDLTDEEKDDVYHKMLELAQKFSEKLAFVQVKGVNEFEYNEEKFTEKVQKCIREINEEFETNMENDVNQFKADTKKDMSDMQKSINIDKADIKILIQAMVNEITGDSGTQALNAINNYESAIRNYNQAVTTVNAAQAIAEEKGGLEGGTEATLGQAMMIEINEKITVAQEGITVSGNTRKSVLDHLNACNAASEVHGQEITEARRLRGVASGNLSDSKTVLEDSKNRVEQANEYYNRVKAL